MAKVPPVQKPRVSVIDRRLNDPFGVPSIPIQFKEPGWVARWFNGAINNDKIWMAKQVQGWDLVTPDLLQDLDQIGGHTISPSGYITRGERGVEVLMRMRADDFDKIQWAKTRKNLEAMQDTDRTKREMVEAAAGRFGGEAGEYLNRHVGPVGEVTTKYERVERLPDGEE